MTNKHSVGIVVIGRNLGALLGESLDSALQHSAVLVYVDSGSTDNSVALAHARSVPVVTLDASRAYTAARGRNAGARFLLHAHPNLEYIQFVDGDCLMADGFIPAAVEIMHGDARIAVVAGQRRERFPQASIYQQLAVLEWQTPLGEIEYFGGDALVRVTAFEQVNGYNPKLIAGEEADTSVRLRRAGWKIWSIPTDMTYHDMRMTQFKQWWHRNARAGYGYAAGVWMHGRGPERHRVRESASIWFWGAGVWLTALGLARRSRGASLLLLMGYPLLLARIYKRSLARGWSPADARRYALFCVLGKFTQIEGQLLFLIEQLRGDG